jgi:hypothetical protein
VVQVEVGWIWLGSVEVSGKGLQTRVIDDLSVSLCGGATIGGVPAR